MSSEKKPEDAPQPTRRSFLNKLWIGLGFVALAEIAALAVGFLRPRKPAARQDDFGRMVAVGAVKDFPLSSVTAFKRGHFYLVRLADGGFLALSRTCTHLGCTVPWDEKEKKFICPCHASVFDITGSVLRSPAPRALDIYPVSIDHDIVKVDTARRIKRGEFRTDQATYPQKKI
jgi:cytochrome b6-f complex iron-sulfur subunit